MVYTSLGRDLMPWMDQHQARRGCGCTEQGEWWWARVSAFSVLVCGIWTFLRDYMIYSRSWILRYKEKNYDILIVMLRIHQLQNLCNVCAVKIGPYLKNKSSLCHDLTCDMCMEPCPPTTIFFLLIACLALRYSSSIPACANIAKVLWPSVCLQ